MRHLGPMIVCTALGCGGIPPADVTPRPSSVPVASPPLADASLPATVIAAPKDPLDEIQPSCRGAALSFDTEERENECLIPNRLPHDLPSSPGPDDLEVMAAVAEKSVAPGRTATVVVTLTNKTTKPMLLHVDRTCDDEPLFPISVLDTKKKRVDLITHKNCDSHTFGCTRRVLRIVLEPGGSLHTTRSYATKVTRVVADCGEVPAGSMKPGNYVLRVVTGLDRDAELASSRTRKWMDTPLVVK